MIGRQLLVLVLIITAVITATGVVQADTITVCPNGCDYTSIQAAIDTANTRDIIEVHSGTYYENVVVNKQLTLRGVDTGDGKPVVDAGGSGNAITLSVNGITIEGFSVTNSIVSFEAGIKVTSNNNNLLNNNATKNSIGIYLENSEYNTLNSNIASNNEYYGIVLRSSSNNTLKNNYADSHYLAGISLDYSSNYNTLINNTAISSMYSGINIKDSNDNILTNNTASNITFWAIHLEHSSNNTLLDNNASNNNIGSGHKVGIYLIYSSNNNTLIGNIASNNGAGIQIWQSSNNNKLIRNIAANNREDAVRLSSSNNITLTNNTFANNGLRVWDSHYNHVKNNTVNGKPIVYLEDISDFDVKDAGQVILVQCRNITVENLDTSNATVGIELWETENSKIINNTVNSNKFSGICFMYSSNNTLANNTANSNRYSGIYLCSSNNNLIYNNYFNNTNNAYDYNGTNVWNVTPTAGTNIIGGSLLGGNYWGDYTGTDPEGDSLGDSEYPIAGGSNFDYRPLCLPKAFVKGDLNNDGTLSAADAAIALAIAASGAHDQAADASGDGRVTSLDALMIMQAAAGAIEL
jgi:parallel beta-helix repeat protein